MPAGGATSLNAELTLTDPALPKPATCEQAVTGPAEDVVGVVVDPDEAVAEAPLDAVGAFDAFSGVFAVAPGPHALSATAMSSEKIVARISARWY